ncbi:MAG: ABC-F family ATP-binding cassette domain-containing protein [Candidatus Puniceispirillum sp.]|nr:ABC-F family ATP-binding cassette domain-containing protein [Candidatus Puniceispirillum sp.]MBL6774262.1 ABC-F family ATP-binding cassette domain-containing protein [Candidatus Puniceispirillum sp.]
MTPPLLTIADAGVNLGDRWLLRGADLSLHAGDRLALVGPNGAGKSTLMKLLSGHGEMDEGTLWMAPGAEIAYLPQAPQIPSGMSLRSIVIAGMEDATHGHKADAMLMRMGLDPMRISDGLSGGEARRVSLARALYTKPDILLLDEPTNHMDLPTIEWMEDMLRQHKGALLVVSHDRAFLRNLGTGIIWLHDSKLRRRDGHFDEFEAWSDDILTEEAVVLHKMDRRIASETKWSREGISARRKRNQGRLRELAGLRTERAKAGGITQRAMRMETGPADGGGQLVLEAIDLCASVPITQHGSDQDKADDRPAARRQLLQHFNLLVRRTDRIGIVGPNGVGKSTLVRLLLEITKPDSGRVRQGFGLIPAYFDQRREALDRDQSPWTILSEGGSDMIEVAGQTKHVTSYLRDFMFDDVKMTQRVSTLSGGEQNRLLLAKLFAQTHNFLVLDEPTNDLDIETLELLQEVIADYDGTVLIVSHDRDFLDRTVTAILAFEGDAKIVVHAGGYSDYLARKKAADARKTGKVDNKKPKKSAPDKPKGNRPARLSFRDKHRLDTLPGEIDAIDAKIAATETKLAAPNLFQNDPEEFNQLADSLTALRNSKELKEMEWLEAAEKAEALERTAE